MQVALTVPELVAQGRFKESLEAIRALPQDRRRTPDIMLAEAESLMETGDLQRASLAAERTLQGQTNPVVRVKSLRFLGQIAFNEGDGRRCGEFLRLARSIAFESRAEMPDLHAAILLITWRLLGGTKEYGASEVDFNELRRAVLRSGSAHSIVELRAGVAELEARKSNPHEALRHLECARDLLQAHPNMWLEGLIDNHTSHVFAILGDTDKAVSSALQSIERTAISGHFRVRLSAQINLADLYRQSGELDLAADTLYGVLRAVGSHAHLQAAALDGLVNVSLSNNDLGAARAAFGQLLALRRHNLKHLNSSWFRLSEMFSRARLFEVGGNRVRAYNLMRRGCLRRGRSRRGQHRLLRLPTPLSTDRVELADPRISYVTLRVGDSQAALRSRDNLNFRNVCLHVRPTVRARRRDSHCRSRRARHISVVGPTASSPSPDRLQHLCAARRSLALRQALLSLGRSCPAGVVFGTRSDQRITASIRNIRLSLFPTQ